MTLLQKAKKIPTDLVLGCIWIYRKLFSPTTGMLRILPFYPRPSCIFYPTCSEYATVCFQQYPFLTALHKTTRRIARCHSGTPPQVDLP